MFNSAFKRQIMRFKSILISNTVFLSNVSSILPNSLKHYEITPEFLEIYMLQRIGLVYSYSLDANIDKKNI